MPRWFRLLTRTRLLEAAQHEQEEAQAIEVAARVEIGEPALMDQCDAAPLGAAHHGTGQVERARRGGGAGEDEASGHLDLGLQSGEEVVQLGHVRLGGGAEPARVLRVGSKLSPEAVEAPLELFGDLANALVRGQGLGQSDGAGSLIDRAIDFDAEVVFGHPAAAQETRGAVVATARQLVHGLPSLGHLTTLVAAEAVNASHPWGSGVSHRPDVAPPPAGVRLCPMQWTSLRAQRAWKLIGLAIVVVLAAAVAYLGPGLVRSHSQDSQGTVLITVDQPRGLIDSKVAVKVTGLQAHRLALIRARTVDSSSRAWASFAVFEADPTGTIDLRTSRPLGGSYQVADSMGLFWSMAGPTPLIGPRTYDLPETGESVTLTVELDGKTFSNRNLLREARIRDVVEHHLALNDTGFIGTYFTRLHRLPARRTALLLFGGSAGGQTRDLEASLLASHGYPALSIAYFGEPGLPRELADIPLEYFVKALTWLRAQPEVDPQRVLVSGVSRGSEAAQLLGVYAPNLVHGVIALVPSNVAICAYPGCDGPAWTLGGKALPYTRQFDEPAPTDDPAAVIPVERIQGPVFLACGGRDVIWVSCVYANAIMRRLETSHHAYRRLLLPYPDAGHGIGSLPPYLSGAGRSDREGAIVSDQAARVNAWPQLLSFIAQA